MGSDGNVSGDVTCEGKIGQWLKELLGSDSTVSIQVNDIANLYGGGSFDMDTGIASISPGFLDGTAQFYKSDEIHWLKIGRGDFVVRNYMTAEGAMAHEVLGHGLDYVRGDKRNNQADAIRRANHVRRILGIPRR